MTDKQIFDALCEQIEKDIPGFQVCYKDESFTSKLIGFFSRPFNPNYMKTTTTTRYPRVYFPSQDFVEKDYRRAWKILAHEYVHLWDGKRIGLPFYIGYVAPQIAAVFSLLSILAVWFSNWWLVSLAALVLAAPIPSYWRMVTELRGYTMSIAVNYWRYTTVLDQQVEWVVKNFTGSTYYFMWPFEKDIRSRLEAAITELHHDAILRSAALEWKHNDVFKKVHTLLQESGYART